MVGTRTIGNLIAVAAVSIALLLYAGTQLLAGAVLDRSYPLFVDLADATGLLPDKEVTYRGVAVGAVQHIALHEEGVRVRMGIHEGVEIPTELDVVVRRQSPVGEQAIDLQPVGELGPGTTYHEPGDVIAPRSVTLPTDVQHLLGLAEEVFAPIDRDSARTAVAELADAVRGRREDLRAILQESATFSQRIADREEDYLRLAAASRQVNRALADNREQLAQVITDIADSATILSDMRSEFEQLLATAPPTLISAGDLVARAQPDLSCTLDELSSVTSYMAEPEQLANAAEALRVNRWFFIGFHIGTPRSALGHEWQRVHMVVEPESHPDDYGPSKRPVPDILPGGACTSPFGPGAGAAAQPTYAKFMPAGENDVIPPRDARTMPFRRPARADRQPVASAAPAAAPAQPLPVTGGGLLPVVMGLLLMGAGAAMARRQVILGRAPDAARRQDDSRG